MLDLKDIYQQHAGQPTPPFVVTTRRKIQSKDFLPITGFHGNDGLTVAKKAAQVDYCTWGPPKDHKSVLILHAKGEDMIVQTRVQNGQKAGGGYKWYRYALTTKQWSLNPVAVTPTHPGTGTIIQTGKMPDGTKKRKSAAQSDEDTEPESADEGSLYEDPTTSFRTIKNPR